MTLFTSMALSRQPGSARCHLQVTPLINIGRAVTSAATFLVVPGLAPLLFKIDSAAGILTTFKRCANR